MDWWHVRVLVFWNLRRFSEDLGEYLSWDREYSFSVCEPVLYFALGEYFLLLLHAVWMLFWFLIYDAHWYLTCYHLTPDTWQLISDTWQLTCYHLILIYLTWCCDTWLNIITPDPCITLHIHHFGFRGTWHDYYTAIKHLVLLFSCTLELMYSWTPEIGRLLILYSW